MFKMHPKASGSGTGVSFDSRFSLTIGKSVEKLTSYLVFFFSRYLLSFIYLYVYIFISS
jgi:hypothetical protein